MLIVGILKIAYTVELSHRFKSTSEKEGYVVLEIGVLFIGYWLK